jgi:hypothetical protein
MGVRQFAEISESIGVETMVIIAHTTDLDVRFSRIRLFR